MQNVKKESAADTKVRARKLCVHEGPPNEEILSKSTVCDFLLMVYKL